MDLWKKMTRERSLKPIILEEDRTDENHAVIQLGHAFGTHTIPPYISQVELNDHEPTERQAARKLKREQERLSR